MDIDILQPSLQNQASIGLPLVVPWLHQYVGLGTSFRSSLATTANPWVHTDSPFLPGELKSIPLVYEGNVEGRANFRDAETTIHSTGMDHISGSLGLTINTLFIKASVTGTYDKTVLNSNDSNRVSRTCLVREGAVRFKSEPRFSVAAKHLLATTDGRARFKELYGDYFVSCYVLGGDSGVYVSASHDSTTTTTKESVTVTVKVLFFKKAWTKETSETDFKETFHVTLSTYDTLSNASTQVNPPKKPSDSDVVSPEQFKSVLGKCTAGLKLVDGLPYRVRQKLAELKMNKDGDQLSWDRCADICNSGVVVQLILMPFSYLRDYKIASLIV